ncbi:MAG: hypothetical protein HY279_05810 [Nitrospinae bacterium]|nr:hypothetical protein [Nitrospinota bacterium]
MHKIDGVSLANAAQSQNVKKPLKAMPNVNAAAVKDTDGDNDVESKESASSQKSESTKGGVSTLIDVKA